MNPIIKDVGMSDPHVRIFEDTLYLYSGRDDHPDDPTWVMKDWRIFASTDLVEWKPVGVISPADNYMGAGSTDCWAGDAACRDGRYFFYFSDRTRGIGVMAADDPAGPFRDVLGKPLVSPMHDPTVLIDDDPARTPYILYGEKSGAYHVVRLNHDMVSLAEEPKPITIRGKEWEQAPDWMDKNYLFKHGGRYFLSWGRDYAVSDSIYGPYECVGAVGHGHHLDEYAHGSFFWWKGQFYHIWCYYLRTGFKYRESIISYCHIDGDRIVTDTEFLDRHFGTGVGRYEAAWPKIRAAWFYEAPKKVRKVPCPEGSFAVADLCDGDWLRFAKMDFGAGVSRFTARLKSAGTIGALELRLDALDGPCIGRLAFSGEETNPGEWVTHSWRADPVSGRRDLYLRVTGGPDVSLTMSWFSFGTPAES